MAQEHNSKVLGDALEAIMQERKYEEKTTQRRNSASERLNIPLLDQKRIQRFNVDDESVRESYRAKMMKDFEARKRKEGEWRSQHVLLAIDQDDPLVKKKRAKSEMKKLHSNYIKAVTTNIVDNQEEKKGKFHLNIRPILFIVFCSNHRRIQVRDVPRKDRVPE